MSFFEKLAQSLAEESRKVSNKAGDFDFQIDDLHDEIRHLRRELASLGRSAGRTGARALHDGAEGVEAAAETAVKTARNNPASVLALIAAGYFTVRLFRNR
ncbi:hypothetical protein [Hyphococcus sp.]|uniref:hypothetical protein n=1 Tax=Hyphococcus sp. TaxID=2038636 RepID=UPI003CCBA5DF